MRTSSRSLKPQDAVKSELFNKSETPSSSKNVVFIIFFSLLLDLLGFTMILPLFPSLLDYYNKSEGASGGLYSQLLNGVKKFQHITGTPEEFVTVLFGGVLGSMYCFLQFLASPLVGRLSDIYGRKPTLLVCLLGITISHVIWSRAHTFAMFVLARFIGGLSKANVSLIMAIIADVSNESTRARGMALVGLAFSIGFILGPMAGVWFAKSSSSIESGMWGESAAMCAVVLSLANVLLILLCLPETLIKNKKSTSKGHSRVIDLVSPYHLLNFTVVKQLSKVQKLFLSKIGIIYFLYLFVYSGLEFTLTFLTHHTFNFTKMQQGKMFLVIGLIMAILQGGAARRLGPRGAIVASKAALFLTPISFLFVANAGRGDTAFFVSALVSLWIGLVLFAISTAFAVSCMTSICASRAPAAYQGSVLGCLRSLGALARASGPLIASAAYWIWGAPFTYMLGSLALILPAYMICKLKIT